MVACLNLDNTTALIGDHVCVLEGAGHLRSSSRSEMYSRLFKIVQDRRFTLKLPIACSAIPLSVDGAEVNYTGVLPVNLCDRRAAVVVPIRCYCC